MGFLVQSSHGDVGNFELVVPRARGGGARHWWRDNDQTGLPWIGPAMAFGSPGSLAGLSVIQSDFGTAGNLEMVASQGPKLVTANRDDGGTWRWTTPGPLPGTAAPGTGPALVQGSSGVKGNFEVVAPLAAGGLGHWWRDNDSPSLPWYGPTAFATGQYAAAAMVEGALSGHLEVVATEGNELVHWWRDENLVWHPAGTLAGGVTGRHDVVEALDSGHYEVVAPLVAGGMGHWWADPAAPEQGWHGTGAFGTGQVLAVGLVHSSYGNLELIAQHAGHLEFWWRDAQHPFEWHGPAVMHQDASYVPGQDGVTDIPYETDIVAIHAALLHTGKVVVWGFSDFDDGVGDSRVLDPVTGAQQTPPHSHHLFCSGHAFIPDGRMVVGGGHHSDVKSWHTFDPGTGTWDHHQPEMTDGRWYPTCTTLPDGQVFTISGSSKGGPLAPGNPANPTVQRFHPVNGPGAEVPLPVPWSSMFPAGNDRIDLYPFVFLLPSGELVVHSRNVTRFYDPDTDVWHDDVIATHPTSRTYPVAGSAVLLPLLPPDYVPRVLAVAGGTADPEEATMATPATASAEILDLGNSPPEWEAIAPLHFARVMPDAVLLPDGSVVVVGGSSTGRADQAIDPVFAIERFDPATKTWTTLCESTVPRLYHSSALLLPDATVLMLGKDGLFNPDPYHYPEHRGEVFSPPYLFGGTRPTVTGAPPQIHYGQSFSVTSPQAASVDAVHLMRPGSVTHAFNMEQRLVGLVVTGTGGGSVTAVAPPTPAIAPPGFYLLFLLAGGVPSKAVFVNLSS